MPLPSIHAFSALSFIPLPSVLLVRGFEEASAAQPESSSPLYGLPSRCTGDWGGGRGWGRGHSWWNITLWSRLPRKELFEYWVHLPGDLLKAWKKESGREMMLCITFQSSNLIKSYINQICSATHNSVKYRSHIVIQGPRTINWTSGIKVVLIVKDDNQQLLVNNTLENVVSYTLSTACTVCLSAVPPIGLTVSSVCLRSCRLQERIKKVDWILRLLIPCD